jgi:hypothetical protein
MYYGVLVNLQFSYVAAYFTNIPPSHMHAKKKFKMSEF